MKMLHLTTKDLCSVAILLEDARNIQNNDEHKRFSVHTMLKKRKIEGEYWTLYRELMDDEDKVHRCGASDCVRACHAAGLDLIPSRDKFPGRGSFFFGAFPHL